MKLLFITIKYFLIAAVVALTLLLVGTMVPFAGGIKVKIVKSGSMEPAIHTGAIVINQPQDDYRVGDVITFGPDTKSRIPTTHRIVAISGSGAARVFTTKGDANDAPDQTNTHIQDISGKVILTVPYVGYMLDFARKPLGFGLLVGVPALAIIFDEITKIFAEIRKMRRKKRNDTVSKREQDEDEDPPVPPVRTVPASIVHRRAGSDGIARKAVLREMPITTGRMFDGVVVRPKSRVVTSGDMKLVGMALLVTSSLFAFSSVGGTVSYFNDVEKSLGNLLKAGMITLTLSSLDDSAGRRLALADTASTTESGEEGSEYPVGNELFALEVGKDDQSLPLLYSIDAGFDDDAPADCGVMTLEAWIGQYYWKGHVTDFRFPATSTLGRVQFLLNIPLPNDLAPRAKCGGHIDFHAKLAGVPDSLAGTFSDTKSYSFTILNADLPKPKVSEETENVEPSENEEPKKVESETVETDAKVETETPSAPEEEEATAPVENEESN